MINAPTNAIDGGPHPLGPNKKKKKKKKNTFYSRSVGWLYL